MKLTPALSVVTVVMNDLEALKVTVDSVSRLGRKDLEYIIVDGGSTDGTLEYARSLSLSNFKMVSDPDDGIFDAFNKGISLASGVWIHLLNAGDIYDSNNVFDRVDFSVDKSFLCFAVLKLGQKRGDFLWSPKTVYNGAWVDLAHPGLIVRKDYYLSNSTYQTRFKYVSDSHFIFHNVLPEESEIYDITLVQMQGGGYSTKWRFRHELEKQLLFLSLNISVFSRLKLHLKYLIAGALKLMFKE